MRRVVAITLTGLLIVTSVAIASPAFACNDSTSLREGCPGQEDITAQNSGTGTTFNGTYSTTTPGSNGSSSSSASGGGGSHGLDHKGGGSGSDSTGTGIGGGSGSSTTGSGGSGANDGEADSTTNTGSSTERYCTHKTNICLDHEDDEEEVEHVVTITDLARFEASSGVDRMEPNGWIVTGLPTNFYATAKRHVVSGELFAKNVAVRYSPYAWHWEFGDGSTLNSAIGGASWETLGKPEFSTTATSHVFDDPGDYTITLAVDFTAEYRYANEGTWTAIDGHITLGTDPLAATAGSATTVLVGEDCTKGSNAPGC